MGSNIFLLSQVLSENMKVQTMEKPAQKMIYEMKTSIKFKYWIFIFNVSVS